MSAVQEIERAIAALTAEQMDELYAWLDQRHPQPVDVQLQADLDAGLIDNRIHRALDDHKAGNTQPFKAPAQWSIRRTETSGTTIAGCLQTFGHEHISNSSC